MIISRTPFRISFFGGGTDFPTWYNKESGKTISTTIDKYCYISLRELPPFFKYKYRLRYFKQEFVKSVNKIQHPSIRETIKYLKIKQPLEISHSADLPAQSGLGASSSFTVGLVNAFAALNSSILTKKELSQISINIEQNKIKEHVGSQDQTSAAFGGFNIINYNLDKIEVKPVTTTTKNMKDLEDSLFLFFTGYPRKASLIEKRKINKIEKKRNYYEEINNLSFIAEEKLYKSNNIISDFSELMDKYWYLKKKLAENVSNHEIDKLYKKALKNGAYAGKLVGAGGGGFLLFFIDNKKREQLREVFKNYTIVPFKFENSGSQIIYYKKDSMNET
jgi:D-glycero-alpha-D-manno-heptose-7-phosphate kinase